MLAGPISGPVVGQPSIRELAIAGLIRRGNKKNGHNLAPILTSIAKSSLEISGVEFEVLVGICSGLAQSTSAPALAESRQIYDKLSFYLLRSHSLQFQLSPSIKNVSTCPWRYLTCHLTYALVLLAQHDELAGDVYDCLRLYFKQISELWIDSSKLDDNYAIQILFSLQGSLEALTCLPLDSDFATLLVSDLDKMIRTKFISDVAALTGRVRQCPELQSRAISFYGANSIDQGSLQTVYSLGLFYLRYASKSVGQFSPSSLNTALSVDASSVIDYGHESASALFDGGLPNSIDLSLLTAPSKNSERPSAESLSHLWSFAESHFKDIKISLEFHQMSYPELKHIPLLILDLCLQIAVVCDYYDHQQYDSESFITPSLNMYDSEKVMVTAFKAGAFISIANPEYMPTITENIVRLVTYPFVSHKTVVDCSSVVSNALSRANMDIMSFVHSLVNVLPTGTEPSISSMLNGIHSVRNGYAASHAASDITSEYHRNNSSNSHQHGLAYKNVILALYTLAKEYGNGDNNKDVAVLAATFLYQKYTLQDVTLASEIILGLAELAPLLSEKEFLSLVKRFSEWRAQAAQSGLFSSEIDASITQARVKIAKSLEFGGPLYEAYLNYLLRSIIGMGDVKTKDIGQHRSHDVISQVASSIVAFLKPLAALLPEYPNPAYQADSETAELFRNTWFTLAVHGFSANYKASEVTKNHLAELRIIARSSPALVSEVSANRVESQLSINVVLNEGSSNRNIKYQEAVVGIEGQHNVGSKTGNPKLMFLAAATLLEQLRVDTGNISTSLTYFGDPDLRSGDMARAMSSIVRKVRDKYFDKICRDGGPEFQIEMVAEQLKKIFVLCCHRVKPIQSEALECANSLITSLPLILCRKTSMFALLDLVSLLQRACMDAEEDEYNPSTLYQGPDGLTLELSDDYHNRRSTTRILYNKALGWLGIVMDKMGMDCKILLSSYLIQTSEVNMPLSDTSLGRSLAVQAGSMITESDGQSFKFPTISGVPLNTTSGFLSQTTSVGCEKSENEFGKWQSLVPKLTLDSGVSQKDQSLALNSLVSEPFEEFTGKAIEVASACWLRVIHSNHQLKLTLIVQICKHLELSVYKREGLYSRAHELQRPEYTKMEYAPSDREALEHELSSAQNRFAFHKGIFKLLLSVFQSSLLESDYLREVLLRAISVALKGLSYASLHPVARLARFELTRLAIEISSTLQKVSPAGRQTFNQLIVDSALTWFDQPFWWPFGNNKATLTVHRDILDGEVYQKLEMIKTVSRVGILQALLFDEVRKINIWLSPLGSGRTDMSRMRLKHKASSSMVLETWNYKPSLAVHIAQRFGRYGDFVEILKGLVIKEPLKVIDVPEVLSSVLPGNSMLLFWAPVDPISSINLFLPSTKYANRNVLQQFATRSLESHDVMLTFFYVPQIVQLLRYSRHCIEKYILEVAKVSQLFAHQIIWNIKANSSEDDPIQPVFDSVVEKMLASFDDKEMESYNREFGFFKTVTDISGSLQPFIKSSKEVKKNKIDEEMQKVVVEPDVYLPSNPDGVVVDIDRKSGKPLQSHAKAPFMATFKIRRESKHYIDDELVVIKREDGTVETYDVWQSAIFKVGDDCRQDVLALQIIAVFRAIFNSAGLDLYVFPNRVTATAPGCGVIDVLPNSISRDMVGREAVNNLYTYFTSNHGSEDSLEFQRCRRNLVKSLSAYSVISYVLQLKDRHNGNLMYDKDGHILHIDFGFLLDIVPGGVKFEQSPFKLTREMVDVMGGSTETQSYKWFEELCIKAFLASRSHADSIIEMVTPMLSSGLPCFTKNTISNLEKRFVLQKSETEAASYFRGLIRKSFESTTTKIYDEFQKITNGIPY